MLPDTCLCVSQYHIKGRKWDSEKLSNLPKVTQEEWGNQGSDESICFQTPGPQSVSPPVMPLSPLPYSTCFWPPLPGLRLPASAPPSSHPPSYPTAHTPNISPLPKSILSLPCRGCGCQAQHFPTCCLSREHVQKPLFRPFIGPVTFLSSHAVAIQSPSLLLMVRIFPQWHSNVSSLFWV